MEQLYLFLTVLFIVCSLFLILVTKDLFVKGIVYFVLTILVAIILYLSGLKILAVFFAFVIGPISFLGYVFVPLSFESRFLREIIIFEKNRGIKRLILSVIFLAITFPILGYYKLGPAQYNVVSLSLINKIFNGYYRLVPLVSIFFITIMILALMEIESDVD